MRNLTCNLLSFLLLGHIAAGLPQYGGGGSSYHFGNQKPIVIVKDPVQVNNPPGQGYKRKAEVVLVSSGRGGDVQGTLYLFENDEGVLIRGQITGLQPGDHGFHVHMEGNLGDGCVAAGSHFNPFNQPHGSGSSSKRHVGDLGNISTNISGESNVIVFDKVISLDPANPRSVVGRAIVVHEKIDDLGLGGNEESLKTGNAGTRLACGIITLV